MAQNIWQNMLRGLITYAFQTFACKKYITKYISNHKICFWEMKKITIKCILKLTYNICKYVVNYVRNIFVSNMQYVFLFLNMFFYFFIVGFIYLLIFCCMESLISFFFSDRILFYSEIHQIAEVKWVEKGIWLWL